MPKPHFISISGVAGSGKSTVADYLKKYFHQEQYAINDFSFAGPLKDALCLWFGWDRKRLDHDFSYKEGSTLDDGTPDPYCQRLGKTRRQILQTFGTECMRNGMDQNFWIILADLGVHLGKIPPSDLYVISDTRMRNELEWAKSIDAFSILTVRAECPRGQNPVEVKARLTADIQSGDTLTKSTSHASEKEFLGWDGYDEILINIIDQNVSQTQNMNNLISHMDGVVIPAMRKKFNLIGKGTRNWSNYR
jgi:hypothetical protein